MDEQTIWPKAVKLASRPAKADTLLEMPKLVTIGFQVGER
jgi:hypothetical protein